MNDFGRVNLLPFRLRPKHVPLHHRPVVSMALVASVVVSLLALCLYQTLKTHKTLEELTALELRHKTVTNEVAQLTKTQQALEESEKAVKALIKLSHGKTLWSQVFKTLSLAAPKEVWLNELTQTETADKKLKLLLVGEAPSQTSVAALMKALEDSPHFTNITIKFSEQIDGFEPVVFRFHVECILAEPKRQGVQRG